MIDRTLRLTWRKGLLMAAIWAIVLVAHYVVDGIWQSDEPFLTLAVGLVAPMWAISAGVYTWTNSQIAPGRGWRESRSSEWRWSAPSRSRFRSQ